MEKEGKDKRVITSSNQLIESRHPLTLQEMRMFLCMLSEVKYEDEDFQTYRIYIRDFISDEKRENLYTRSRLITRDFLKRVIELKTDTGFIQTHFVSHIEYFKNQGYIEFSFHKLLKPHLLKLKSRFTSYEIKSLLSFRSVFSIRIYQLLKSFEGLKKRKIRIEDLKTLLMIEDKYERWSDFKRYVLETSRKELKKLSSDIFFTYTLEKKGRKYHTIIFAIHKKKQKSFNFSKEEETPYLEYDEVMKRMEEVDRQEREKWKENEN